MTSLTAVDVILPSAAASLLAIIWALMVFLPTYQILKRTKQKWFAQLAERLAFLVVLVGSMFLGGFSSLVYLAAYKNVDILKPQPPIGSIAVIFDLSTWVILSPIIVPAIMLIPISLRWKKAGEKIGVDWA